MKKKTLLANVPERTTMKIDTPTKFATNQFPWKHIDADDFICQLEGYTFRVEQMDKGHWWWRVLYGGHPLPTTLNEFANSKYRAIGLCEGVYLGHIIQNSI